MKKSKIAKAIAVTGVAMCCVFAVACGGGEESPEQEGAAGLTCSETYTGALSARSYTDAQSAVSAYIANEISASATVISSEKTADLTEDEIGALPLTSEQKAGLTSAEVYTVTYSNSASAVAKASYAAADSANTKTRRVFLLVINGEVFYLDPLPETGDELSKSYYDSILGYENYQNCTITQVATVTASAQGQSIQAVASQTVKFDDGKVWYEATVLTAYQDNIQTVTQYAYIEETGSGVIAYVSSDNMNWQRAYLQLQDGTVVTSLSDLLIICAYDYSYLEKTDLGFTIKQDYFQEYVNSALQQYAGATVSTAAVYYYVSEGVVVRAYSRIAASLTVQDVTMSIEADSDANVTDFGTTVVETPAGINS